MRLGGLLVTASADSSPLGHFAVGNTMQITRINSEAVSGTDNPGFALRTKWIDSRPITVTLHSIGRHASRCVVRSHIATYPVHGMHLIVILSVGAQELLRLLNCTWAERSLL